MHLLCCLFFLEAYLGFEQCARYSPGKENATHNALSRVCISEFRSLSPQAAKEPTLVPPSLVQLLLDLPFNLTSPHWKALFAASLSKVSQTPLPKTKRWLETATSSSVLSTTFTLCLSTKRSICQFVTFLSQQGLNRVQVWCTLLGLGTWR